VVKLQQYSMKAGRLREAVQRLIGAADQVIAPVLDRHGETFFAEITDAEQMAPEWRNSLLSPVAEVYPPKETLFTFELSEDGPPKLDYNLDERSRIIFGIRPCDTKAVAHLDSFLLGGEFEDTHYAARRRNTKLITVACGEPAFDTCWCACSDAGPVADEGFDIQLSPVGDRFLVEVAEGGEEIAELWQDLLERASEELIEEREQVKEQVREALELHSHMSSAMRRVTAGALPEEFWEELGARCTGCAGCSLVCPKCTCFSAQDEMLSETTGRRIRIRDSCRLPSYSLEASGHNPREAAADRAKRWSYHKLSQRYAERNGQHGCVGCGRCVQVCMGGVDMVHVTRETREEGRRAKAPSDQRQPR